ncbi:MAG TPA: hypothetical protein VEQ41_05865 [Solirubrobacterales bacterium]|nr:hypothetical protein [Solirubrobacterales bacterium]
MGPLDRPWRLRGAVLALAAVVGVVALIVSGDDDDGSPAAVAPEVRIVEAEELAGLAASLGHPVYWAGPQPGAELELTQNEDGSVQLRYVEAGAPLGEESPDVLTIGTYPLPDPRAALRTFAAEPGSVVRRSRKGLEVFSNETSPSSVYFASPDDSVQVEVYDPSPERALGLALSGQVRPAG